MANDRVILIGDFDFDLMLVLIVALWLLFDSS
jgi:hypothetical protein